MMLLFGLLGGTTSCAEPQEASLGTVSINLIGQAPSGAVYRLRHASISVTGGGATRIWNTEDAPDQTSLSDEVAVGNYTATVAPGWDLERVEGGSARPVRAQLVSSNPASFTVSVHQRTTVPLRFHVDTEDVEMGQGYEIIVTAEESPRQLIVVTNLNDFDAGSITVFRIGSSGDAAPLRTIAGPLTTLVFPLGVTVTDDEIIVCDAATGAVDFFPLLANGNVAPARQIAGPQTGIGDCNDVAVFNDELYVAQLEDLLVFPLTASGDVGPSRRISGFSLGQFLAFDGNELYLTDASTDSVLVFGLPLAEGATPTRSISAHCPTGVTAGNGELSVADGCRGEINVYPETANGDVSPLRTVAGRNTGLDDPEQMARFRGRLYVADVGNDEVLIFPDTAAGNTAPTSSIGGPHTGVIAPIGVAVH